MRLPLSVIYLQCLLLCFQGIIVKLCGLHSEAFICFFFFVNHNDYKIIMWQKCIYTSWRHRAMHSKGYVGWTWQNVILVFNLLLALGWSPPSTQRLGAGWSTSTSSGFANVACGLCWTGNLLWAHQRFSTEHSCLLQVETTSTSAQIKQNKSNWKLSVEMTGTTGGNDHFPQSLSSTSDNFYITHSPLEP